MNEELKQKLTRTAMGIMEANLAGDENRATTLLREVVFEGPPATFAVLGVIASLATPVVRTCGHDECTVHPRFLDASGNTIEPEQVTPASVFAARFISAMVNEDFDMAFDLWLGLRGDDMDPGRTGEGLNAVVQGVTRLLRGIHA